MALAVKACVAKKWSTDQEPSNRLSSTTQNSYRFCPFMKIVFTVFDFATVDIAMQS